MRSLPIRVRVAAAFAVSMALVLSATGLLLYGRLGDDLSAALDTDLRIRGQDLAQVVREPGRPLTTGSSGRLIEHGEVFAQLLDLRGKVLDGTASLGNVALLDPNQLHRVRGGPLFSDRLSVPGLNEPARLLATDVAPSGKAAILVVGATLENRAEALRSLKTELLVVGPIALVLATALGYGLAGSGLRAVEVMRRRAAAISGDRPGERLPVQPTGDELERLGTTLNKMLGRLDDALARERGFVADAGHELRTPLALLRAELDFALHHAETDEELRSALRVASDETDRLSQLAGDLLLIAGSAGGKIPLRPELIPAADLLDSVRNRYAWRAAEAQRRLTVSTPEDLVIPGDRLRLEQALGNLVDNGLRHGEGTVHIEARQASGAAELHVYDEGAGLPRHFVPRAFLRFSRAGEAEGGEGAGLGLAIVQTIAAAHGGSAHVLADESRAYVWMSLPASSAGRSA